MTSEELNRRFIYTPKFFVVLSLSMHLAISILFLSATALHHLNPFSKKTDLMSDMYQDFIQVDVVALPDLLLGEKPPVVDTSLPVVDKEKAAEEPSKAEEQTSEPSMPELSQLEEQKRDAQRKEEQQKIAELRQKKEREKKEREAALKKLQDEANREAALKSLAMEQKGKKGRLALKGNILSKGTSASGKIGTSSDRYRALVAQKIKEHFNIFEWQTKKALVSVVFIKIYPTGMVSEKRVVKPSSDSLYDSAVLQAIDEAQPLPVPEDFSLVERGFNIEFRPKE